MQFGNITRVPSNVSTVGKAGPRRYVYIAGTSYSGSTLLSFLLNAQPGVSSVGEVAWSVPRTGAGDFPCSCGAPLSRCGFWSDVRARMHERGYKFSADHWDMAFEVSDKRPISKLAVRTLGSNAADSLRDRLFQLIPGYVARLSEVGRRNEALMDCILEATRATAFVDASKDPNRIRYLRDYAGIEPYVIHLVRDAPALVNSVLRQRASKRRFRMALQWWNSTARHMERLQRTTDGRHWLLVRYEDLCADPGKQLRVILDFLGFNTGDPIVDFRRHAHHIIGNRMRLGESSEITLDAKWRTALTSEQIAQTAKATKQHRIRLGYSDLD